VGGGDEQSTRSIFTIDITKIRWITRVQSTLKYAVMQMRIVMRRSSRDEGFAIRI
jgi:hypothetical protein